MIITATFALEAQQCLDHGDPATAIVLCKQGLALYPDYPTAHLVLARALLALGDYVGADKAIEHSLQSSPRLTGVGSTFGSLRKNFLAAKSAAAKSAAARASQQNATNGTDVANGESGTPASEAIRQSELPPLMEVAALEAALAFRLVEKPDVELESQDPAADVVEEVVEQIIQKSIVQRPIEPVPVPTPDVTTVDAHESKVERVTEQTEVRTIGGYLKLLPSTNDANTHGYSLRSNNVRLIPGLEFTSLRVELGGFATQPSPRRGYSLPELPEPNVDNDYSDEWADGGENDYDYDNDHDNRTGSDNASNTASLNRPSPRTTGLTNARTSAIPGLASVARFRVSDIEQLYPHAAPTHDAIGDELDVLARLLDKAQMPPAEELMEREADAPNPPLVLTDDDALIKPPVAPTILLSDTMARIYEAQGAHAAALQAYQSLAAATTDDAKRAEYAEKIAVLMSKMNPE